MVSKLTDKIKLFRILHGVNHCYIDKDEKLYKTLPKNFTGIYLQWNEKGNLKYKMNIKNGVRDRKCEGWYENGQKAWESNYKNGKEHGENIGWYENGIRQYTTFYNNGIRIV